MRDILFRHSKIQGEPNRFDLPYIEGTHKGRVVQRYRRDYCIHPTSPRETADLESADDQVEEGGAE